MKDLGGGDLGESVKGKLPKSFSISSIHIYSASGMRTWNLDSWNPPLCVVISGLNIRGPEAETNKLLRTGSSCGSATQNDKQLVEIARAEALIRFK